MVDIHGLGFTVAPALAQHVRRGLGVVLTRHSDRIQQDAVRVGDENGPRGGVDTYRRIKVCLTGVPVSAITDVSADLYAVIDRAASGRNNPRSPHAHPDAR